MLGRIKKDLYLLLNNRRLFYIVLVMYLFMSFMSNQDYTLFIPLMAVMMFMSSFNYDEFNNWHGYGATLPNGKENIVKAKYVTAIGILTVSTIMSLLLSAAVGLYKKNLVFPDSISMMLGIDAALLILVCILFPIIFKFGYEKGRIALFVVSFGISGIVILLSKIFNLQISASLILFLEKYGIYLAAAALLVMLYGSYRISRKIYLNKEF